MKTCFIFLITLIIFSCSNSPLPKKLDKADDLVIYFYSATGKDSVYKIVHTNDEKAIHKLIDFSAGREITGRPCAINGKMVFRQKEKEIQSIYFNNQTNQCLSFSFDANGVKKYTSMSREGADFLTALRDGQKTY